MTDYDKRTHPCGNSTVLYFGIMENYIVSARKYRPDTFESVVAQKSLTTTLKNAIRSGKLAHAYLFCGPRGVGKTTCARIFAKTINCLHPTSNGEPCNECESCLSFNQQRSYSIYELDAASNNSVEDIRSLNEQVRIPPQIGKYKVYIIDEVHMLSQAAFNAFLKTLEEPPAHAIFILATTEKHKILPTILSRCQIYDFSRIESADIIAHLQGIAAKEGITAEHEALRIIAQKSDGCMRDALSLFDQMASFTQGELTYSKVISSLNVLDYEYYFRLTDFILDKKVPQALLLFNEVLAKGFNNMAENMQALVDEIKEDEAKLRRVDLRLLQEQINPHFLYNTLDTIVWLIEGNETEKAEKMVVTLSNFFRLVLSKGKEFITIREEEQHIGSYLAIQEMRYHDIMEYDIQIDKVLYDYQIPKLTLQPLVENALYHGLKYKRAKGYIHINGEKTGDVIVLTVRDNGVGMDEEELEVLRKEIERPCKETEKGFGMANVNERIHMYFGQEYGMTIHSKKGKGTIVEITIPAIKSEEV